MGRLSGLSTQLQSKTRDLQDQLASFAAQTMQLKENTYYSIWKTVLKCLEFMNCQSNTTLINVPENRSSITCVQRQTLAKYLQDILSVLNIPNPFTFKNRFHRIGVVRDSRSRSIVVEFSSKKDKEVTRVCQVSKRIPNCLKLVLCSTLQVPEIVGPHS